MPPRDSAAGAAETLLYAVSAGSVRRLNSRRMPAHHLTGCCAVSGAWTASLAKQRAHLRIFTQRKRDLSASHTLVVTPQGLPATVQYMRCNHLQCQFQRSHAAAGAAACAPVELQGRQRPRPAACCRGACRRPSTPRRRRRPRFCRR